MPGRSPITADDEERGALRGLARSPHRGEADRARAVLLTLEGWRAEAIARILDVHVSTVREWRGLFARGRVAALKRRTPPGRPSVVGARAVALAQAILAEDTRHDAGWTLPRLAVEIRRRGGPGISRAWLAIQLRKGGSLGAGPATASRAAKTGRRSRRAASAASG